MGTKRAHRLAGECLPDLLTVEEAAVLLRIGRNQAYGLTREWRATGGQRGIPVIELSPHTFRVPLHALEEQLGAKFTRTPLPGKGLTVVPDPDVAVDQAPAETAGSTAGPGEERGKVTPLRRAKHAGPDQLSLFDPGPS